MILNLHFFNTHCKHISNIKSHYFANVSLDTLYVTTLNFAYHDLRHVRHVQAEYQRAIRIAIFVSESLSRLSLCSIRNIRNEAQSCGRPRNHVRPQRAKVQRPGPGTDRTRESAIRIILPRRSRTKRAQTSVRRGRADGSKTTLQSSLGEYRRILLSPEYCARVYMGPVRKSRAECWRMRRPSPRIVSLSRGAHGFLSEYV